MMSSAMTETMQLPCSRTVSSFLMTDVDQLEFLFPNWDTRCTQLGRGTIRANLSYVDLDGVECRQGESNLRVHVQCSSLVPAYSFSGVVAGNANWLRQGRVVEAGTIEVTPPGGSLDFTTVASTGAEDVSVAVSSLHEAIEVLLRRDPEDVIPGGTFFQPAPGPFAAFQAAIVTTIEEVRLVSGFLEENHVLERQRSRCLVALCDLLEGAKPQVAGSGAPSSRYELVREAEDLMDLHLSQPLSTFQLCHTLCVSRRTLFYAFQEARGLAPMTLYRYKRLNRVRGELRASSPEQASVGGIARRWGFRHAGQFAKDYSALFGECPSDTLASRVRRSC